MTIHDWQSSIWSFALKKPSRNLGPRSNPQVRNRWETTSRPWIRSRTTFCGSNSSWASMWSAREVFVSSLTPTLITINNSSCAKNWSCRRSMTWMMMITLVWFFAKIPTVSAMRKTRQQVTKITRSYLRKKATMPQLRTKFSKSSSCRRQIPY